MAKGTRSGTMAPATLLMLAASLLLSCGTCAAGRSSSGKERKMSFDIRGAGWELIGRQGAVGSTYYFTQVATMDGKDYGMPGWCSLTASKPALWACNYQYDLEDGSIMVQGIYKADDKDVWTGTLAVVGGTGKYKGVSGEEFQIWDNGVAEKGTATLTLRY